MRKITIRRYAWSELTPSLKEELRRQVLLNFPKIKAFRTRFYYQIPPSFMFVARAGRKIVGQRYLTWRVRPIDGKRRRIAGIGISVHPDFQGRGIGQELTRACCAFVGRQRCDFVMATTGNPAARHVLSKFGFTVLRRPITYRDRETGKLIRETDCVLVLDFAGGETIRDIEKQRKPLYVGKGAW
ncbi:MAG: GNAT family N-acetyltransferase [Candidatus Colwellbacteria bacterium]|nr:GNAT family N-acetyltransferase [Candidatus Colwellbacteria bacterium]